MVETVFSFERFTFQDDLSSLVGPIAQLVRAHA